ncbi:hypothetical protein Tco_1017706 [Tanacetum coccineum]|uniref:No apical meristem-associated C-terminal domain-containing protein n=1 Tax=Tanacetum coccineum TaxID=301880 RepID=A0ABQ5FSB8_9ASTR
MDDDTEDVEEGSSTVMQRWKAEEEKLLCETWIKVSKSNAIGADRNLDTFWWQVMHACNKATCIVNRMKDMIMESNTGNKKFNLEHAWRVLKEYPKWDAPDPSNPVDLTELFDDDVRPRPAGKPRLAKKNKSDGTSSTAGSRKSDTLSEILHSEFKLKRKAVEKAYEAWKQKDLAIMECKELEFLTISTDGMPMTKPPSSTAKKNK